MPSAMQIAISKIFPVSSVRKSAILDEAEKVLVRSVCVSNGMESSSIFMLVSMRCNGDSFLVIHCRYAPMEKEPFNATSFRLLVWEISCQMQRPSMSCMPWRYFCVSPSGPAVHQSHGAWRSCGAGQSCGLSFLLSIGAKGVCVLLASKVFSIFRL